MMKTTAYKTKSGFPCLWKANSTLFVDVIKQPAAQQAGIPVTSRLDAAAV